MKNGPSGGPVSPRVKGGVRRCRRARTLLSRRRNLCRHADFLTPLELYDAAIMHHDFDRSEPEPLEGGEDLAEDVVSGHAGHPVHILYMIDRLKVQ